MTRGRLRRGVVGAAALVTALVIVGAGPAGADPAAPTNFSSQILSVEPPLAGASVEIQGGDAFIALTVDAGHEAVVPDYSGASLDRPYLRFLADGTVQVNDASAAAAANESRYGSNPAGFDPDAPPVWRTVARDGSYAWHDHRIHLMVPDDMAVVDDAGRVDLGGDDGTWEVPVVVDGVTSVIRGELLLRSAPSPWPWYALATLLAVIAIAAVVLVPAVPGAALGLALLVTAGAATAVSAIELGRAPEGSGASAVPVFVAAAAVVGAGVALAGRWAGRRGPGLTRAGTAAAAAALLWWAVTRVDVLDHIILPSDLGNLDRLVTAAALGWAVAAATVLVWRPHTMTERR